MNQDDRIAELEAELKAVKDPARLELIMRLVQLLGDRYQKRQGTPAGLRDLDSIVVHLRDARRMLPEDDGWRARTAGTLGLMLAMRHLGHQSPDADRDEAIELLAEAGDAGHTSPAVASVARFMTGQLLVIRGIGGMSSVPASGPVMDPTQPMAWMRSGADKARSADLDNGIAHMERTLAQSPPPEIRQVAETVLPMVRILRDMMRAMSGDGSALGGLFSAMQRMRDAPVPTAFSPGLMRPPALDLSSMLAPPTLTTRPVPIVVDVPVVEGRPAGPEPRPSIPAPREDQTRADREDEELHRELRRVLDRVAPGQDATALLRPDLAPVAPAEAEDLCELALAAVHRTGTPADHLTAAVALWVRSRAGGGGWSTGDARHDSGPDVRAGATNLVTAVETLDPADPLLGVALAAFAAFLGDRHPLGGVLDDLAERYLVVADRFLAGGTGAADVRALRELCAGAARLRGTGSADLTALDSAVDAVPDTHPWRFRLLAARGTAHLIADRADPSIGRDLLDRALADAPHDHPGRPGLAVLRAVAVVVTAYTGHDPAALDRATDRLAALSSGRFPAPGLSAVLGAVRLYRGGGPVAVRLLTEAAEAAGESGGRAVLASWHLALALRPAPDARKAAREHGLRALRGDDGAASALDATAAGTLAAWCVTDGDAEGAFEALEAAWCRRSGPVTDTVAEVLYGALHGWAGPAAAAPAPAHLTVDAAARTLRELAVDTLVRLHPCDDGIAVLLLDASTATVKLAGIGPDPGPTTGPPPPDWYERARLVPGPDAARRRLVLVVPDALAAQPWHAVWGDAGTTVTYAGAAGELAAAVGRSWRPLASDAVFIANPRGDRDAATFDALTLRRLFHPTSVGLGQVVERVDGAGTPEEVWPHLPGPGRSGAALLHLGCAVRSRPAVALGLAGGTWLRLAARPETPPPITGGLVVLPPDCADPASVADAFLGAGSLGVVGWLWPVPASVAGAILTRLHAYLVDEGLTPSDAVAAVRQRLAEPETPAPHGFDLAAPEHRDALWFRGRP